VALPGTDIRELVEQRARAARDAARVLATASSRTKAEALLQMARGVEEKAGLILEANRADLERARGQGLARAFLDRLTLTEVRLEDMAAGIRQVAALPDPVGEIERLVRRPNGM
jgi:glutamate-5-semialdehyde dehydrogenase